MSVDTENMRYNMTMWQGATFKLSINVKDSNNANMNLADYAAFMQIRETYDSGIVVESLTTANGEISLDAANGVLALELAAERTANINVDLTSTSIPPKTVYVYDIDLEDSNNKITKILFGTVEVYGEVTR